MTTETKPWPLMHQGPEALATSIEWHGYVGADNIEAITERVKKIVVPGRTFVVIRQDREGPAEVEQGSTLYINPEAFRAPIACSSGEHGGGMSVNMWPGIRGFGVGFDYAWDSEVTKAHPMTGLEVRERANATEKYQRTFNWSWIEIHGGLDGWQHQDRIVIRKCNEDNYQEIIQIIPADIPWQLRHVRDAIAAEQIAARIHEAGPYEPGEGIDPEHAAIAAEVLRKVAANLRRSHEPLGPHEIFPAYEGMS